VAAPRFTFWAHDGTHALHLTIEVEPWEWPVDVADLRRQGYSTALRRGRYRGHTGLFRGFAWESGQRSCQWCGASLVRVEDSTVDHVVPRSRLGTDNWSNLVLACRPCNLAKAGSLPDRIPSGRRWRSRLVLGDLGRAPVWVRDFGEVAGDSLRAVSDV
jgi:hypothetical protein